VKYFLIALQFLTILPVRIKSDIKETDCAHSLLYFPIVGGLIGLVLSISVFLFGFLPDMVMAVIVLAISVILTGGIHLDGFADTCDGFYGNRSRDEILRIMRDSRVGVMGVIGIVMLLLFKFSLIAAVPKVLLIKSLIMMTTFARWSQALSCLISNYARSEGKGRFFMENVNKKDIVAGGIFTLLLFLLVIGIKGLLIFGAGLLLTFLFVRHAKHKIDGMTGDTIGAVSEIAEASIFLLVILWN